MCKDYDLDFTRLSNYEFISVLEHFALPEYQSYIDLMANIQDRRAENRKFNLQSKLKELQEQILQHFYHILPEYCNFILYLSESAYEEREHVAAQEIPLQIAQFAHVEDQLTTRRQQRVQEDNDRVQKKIWEGPIPGWICWTPDTGKS